MTEPESHLEIADGVGVFTLNRPKALNALSPEMFARDLPDMVTRAETDDALRVLILTGAGGNFCSGADVKRMAGANPRTPDERDANLRGTLDWIYRLATLDQPVIAAVDGIAYGGGFSLALTADFILATPRTRFCLVFGRIGLIPDMGAAALLTRVIGPQRTKALAFTARSLDATEAMALGIVHAIHEPDDLLPAAQAMARRLAQGSRTALAQAKRLIDAATHGSQADMVDAELAAQRACRDTEFHREAVRRFATKEPALYNWDAMMKHADGLMPGGAVDSILRRAKAAQDAGDFAAADRLYRDVLARQPENADALHQFGVLAGQQGRTRIAAKRIRRAIAIDGDAADFHLNLGVVLEIGGDLAGAFASYRDALERGAATVETLMRQERIVRQTGQYDVFADILARVTAAQPGLADAHYLLGVAQMMQQRPGPAADAFQAMIALTPDYAPAHANLAMALLERADMAGALAACDACLALAPGHTDALAVKAIALNEVGDHDARDTLADLDRLLHVVMLDPPDGYGDIADFNTALVRDIQADPTLALDPNHRSCHFSEQTGDLMQAPSAAFCAFADAVQSAVRDYCRKLATGSRYPFLANPKPPTDLVVWATVMNAKGHQSAHIHPSAWLSGVYYPALPDLVRDDDDTHQGWIEFGQPPDRLPVTAEPKLRLIKPEEGMLVLFPSYLYHRTVPYAAAATRISIAFDLDTEFAKQI